MIQIKTYKGVNGFMVFLGLVAGLVLLVLVVFWGIKEVMALVLPLLTVISQILIIAFLCVVLPLSLFVRCRVPMCRWLVVMANILGATSWVTSFLFVIATLGILGVLFCLLLQFLIPVGLLAALLKGSWDTAGKIALWFCGMCLMKFYAHWLSRMDAEGTQRKNVIDVEIETK